MNYFWETVNKLPAPLRLIIVVIFIGIFLYLFAGFFNIPLALPDYVINIISSTFFVAFGLVLLYGGIADLRQARREGRKPIFYKQAGIVAGIACVVVPFLLLYAVLNPHKVSDTVELTLIIIIFVVFVLGIAPAGYHYTQAMNKAGVDALKEVQREEEERKAQRERLRAEGEDLPEPHKEKGRNWLRVAVAVSGLLVWLACVTILVVDTLTRSVPYDFLMLGFSFGWLCWSVAAIMNSQDQAHEQRRSWRPWYLHVSSAYFIASLLCLCYYVTHYLLVTRYMLAKDIADKFNVIPFIVLVAVIVCSNIVTNKKARREATRTS
ncbi:hypothetical protein KDA_72820 [Dictyobacter alpinus]|uniref:Uncharacterized protein n=1 Tax=Dictyobacter alpinus TaxID=2014873 RepID=A0A402BKB5_9CHLR|nr:hypothetical protein [Dictyobacter alpinus]GCE31798.1 hypothetical protein KDA_72820 [Dictyobacter alpinus]